MITEKVTKALFFNHKNATYVEVIEKSLNKRVTSKEIRELKGIGEAPWDIAEIERRTGN